MVKEQYNVIKKKFSLPDYDKLNYEFEISSIEEEDFLLRQIRKKIVEKIHRFLDAIQPIVQPEAVVSDVQESEYFEENELRKVFDLYRQLKILDKKALELSADEDDEETAEFISYVFKIWPDMKKQMKEIAKKLQKAWEQEIVSKEETSYLR